MQAFKLPSLEKKDMIMQCLYNLNIVLLISNIKSCIDGEHKKNRKKMRNEKKS
jgi:hypothetical protein